MLAVHAWPLPPPCWISLRGNPCTVALGMIDDHEGAGRIWCNFVAHVLKVPWKLSRLYLTLMPSNFPCAENAFPFHRLHVFCMSFFSFASRETHGTFGSVSHPAHPRRNLACKGRHLSHFPRKAGQARQARCRNSHV
jgi:hypothetical protein